MKLKPGEIINGRYMIEQEIDAGEKVMAYTCVDIQSRIKYVIEHPVYDDKYDDSEVEWLKKEAQILRTLFHPYIVKYIDSFEENNVFYLVTEYLGAKDMETLFKNRPATKTQARNYCEQLLTAQEYLHNKNIIHPSIGPHIK